MVKNDKAEAAIIEHGYHYNFRTTYKVPSQRLKGIMTRHRGSHKMLVTNS